MARGQGMRGYIGYFGTSASRRAAERTIRRLLARIVTKPLRRIQRATERRSSAELTAALERPPSRAPVWVLRALAVSAAAPEGDDAVLQAAFEAVNSSPKKLRRALTATSKPKKRNRQVESRSPYRV